VELGAAPESRDKGGFALAGDGRPVWGGEVRAEGAWRLRLHLADVRLPAGARLWVYGEGGEVAPSFGPELIGPGGGIWTPSVGGGAIRLEVVLPAGAEAPEKGPGFTIDRVLELVDVPAAMSKALDCRVDGNCVTPGEFGFVQQLRRAVGVIEYVSGSSSSFCSSGLLNDADPRTTVPYLLTAAHCISEPEEAASAETYFDFVTSGCDGIPPDRGGLPRAVGATLPATVPESDASLLRLSSLPPGRVLLGWTARPLEPGTLLHRLSHALELPQVYSVTRVDPDLAECPTSPRPRYIHSATVRGGAAGGSSGGPAVLGSGHVVGQIRSGCGAESSCPSDVRTIDGAFAVTYPEVRQFLDPVKPCVQGPETLCLADKRFEVRVDWQNQFDGRFGTGKAVRRSDNTGFFYFSSPSNTELILKVLDFGDVVKVFYGQLTDLRFTMTVTDTRTGRVKTYRNGPRECGGIDQEAFPGAAALAAPAAGAVEKAGRRGGCAAGKNALCLLDKRLRVEVDWRNPADGTSGRGVAGPLGQQSGLFSFSNPANVELVVKALPFQDRIAVFYGALSDLDYTITVTDTRTGAVKAYSNPSGNFCGGIDNQAF
ncbi:MAG TPA: hypothetical protein VEL74_07220, partial [Thermoanaerobaculia bacterium]|nr:hypothetical protein [Thermoanaerobaculia bacterium]